MVVRRDNTPHYPELKGFPHHKLTAKQIVESDIMAIGKVLEKLKKMVNTK
jgi:hypothetical protein